MHTAADILMALARTGDVPWLTNEDTPAAHKNATTAESLYMSVGEARVVCALVGEHTARIQTLQPRQYETHLEACDGV
jgi:hypothetical protein